MGGVDRGGFREGVIGLSNEGNIGIFCVFRKRPEKAQGAFLGFIRVRGEGKGVFPGFSQTNRKSCPQSHFLKFSPGTANQ